MLSQYSKACRHHEVSPRLSNAIRFSYGSFSKRVSHRFPTASGIRQHILVLIAGQGSSSHPRTGLHIRAKRTYPSLFKISRAIDRSPPMRSFREPPPRACACARDQEKENLSRAEASSPVEQRIHACRCCADSVNLGSDGALYRRSCKGLWKVVRSLITNPQSYDIGLSTMLDSCATSCKQLMLL